MINVKDFGAVGNGTTNDTPAIQAAIDAAFGPASAPHGTHSVNQNQELYFPNGHYRIVAPLLFSKLHGGRVMGAGRFVSRITQATPNLPVFVTNGCGYAHFEGLRLEGSGTAKVFDLSWDGTAGGAALQSNTFTDIFFDGGSFGMYIGGGGFMGSENIFNNCFWIRSATAGLYTANSNALQQTVIGGNFQSCGYGIWIGSGSVPIVQGVGFQASSNYDIRAGGTSYDIMCVSGCRTESKNFIDNQGSIGLIVEGCNQLNATPGYFVNTVGGIVKISVCDTMAGKVKGIYWTKMRIENSKFRGHADPLWLETPASQLWWQPNNNTGACIEVNNVMAYNAAAGKYTDIRNRRITTTNGTTLTVQEYQVA